MLEVNKWFFVHLINFLVLLILLNYILFKPLLCLLTRRQDHIKGSLNSAKAMDKEKEGHLEEIGKQLAGARNNARNIFEGLSSEGLEIQKGFLEAAQKEADSISTKARENLKAEVEKARESLRKDVESFS